jgi:hypothetical protein
MPFFALSNGKLYSSKDITDESAGYNFTCIDCGDSMMFVKGNVKARHFRHIHEERANCSGGEGDQHKLAKYLIAEHIDKWKFFIKCECNIIIGIRFRGRPVQEQLYGMRRLDVGLIENGVVVGGIEVCHTHAVDEDKKKDLSNLQWVEVKAEDVIDGFNAKQFEINTTSNCSGAVDCTICREWRINRDKISINSVGDKNLVRRFVMLDSNDRAHIREPFIETRIKTGKYKDMFYSDILKTEPGIIAFIAKCQANLHNETCRRLLFGRCNQCGNLNKQCLMPNHLICASCLERSRNASSSRNAPRRRHVSKAVAVAVAVASTSPEIFALKRTR